MVVEGSLIEGTDGKVYLEVEAKNELGEWVPVPINSLFNYEIYLYKVSGFKKTLLRTYGKDLTGTFAIGVPDATKNVLTIVIDRVVTSDNGPVKYFIELRVQVSASNDYIESKANSGVTEIDLFPVKSSANKTGLL